MHAVEAQQMGVGLDRRESLMPPRIVAIGFGDGRSTLRPMRPNPLMAIELTFPELLHSRSVPC